MFDTLPPNWTRHFYANDAFLDWWVSYVGDKMVFEVGAGCCDFAKAMIDRKIKVMAIEPRPNPDIARECASFLLPLSVYRIPLMATYPGIVVVARPDHSGWVYSIPSLIHPDSLFIYIGLEKNFHIDLDSDYQILYSDAGDDGEKVLLIKG